MLSRTISEISQLIVQILDIAFLSFLLGLRGNVQYLSWAHWKACSGLPISVHCTFSLGVMVELLRAKIGRKLAISLQRCHFDPNFK